MVAEATAAGFFPPRHNVEITQVAELTDRVMRLTFRDPFIVSHAKPAQFVNLFTHDDFMLMPRPFGVSEVNGDEVSVIFAVVGHGTEQLAQLQAGDTVDVLGPLGRGFNLKEDANYILVGGGLGVPPLIYAAQRLAEHDASFATAVFGYRNDHFAEEYVSRYADWSWSIDDAEGNVVDLLNKLEQDDDLKAYDRKPIILSCGPLPMMKAVAAWAAATAPACCAPSTPWTADSKSAPTARYSPANSSDGGSDDERKQPVRAGQRQPHQPVRTPRVEAPH